MVLNAVVAGHSTVAEAAASLGLSQRQVRRVLAAYQREGAAALAHGNRGRRPAHATTREVARQVVALAQTTYAGCNQQHLRDLLAEREGIVLSRATVHRLLAGAGVLAPPARRPPQHRRRRERRQQAGQLVQIDGSPHAWLQERGPRLTLLAAIDDATGRVEAAVFRAQEDAQGYLLLLWQLVEQQGRPLALYHDRHAIFRPPSTPAERQEPEHGLDALADALAGRQPRTQFGRALEELGIASIAARSPQAKGRVERLFGTLQDRLVSELRLADVTTRETANAFLLAYLPRFNAQFAVPAATPASAYRPLDPTQELAAICCFKYARVVAADHTVTFGPQRLQLLPGPTRRSYAHAAVEVHQRLDGTLAVCYGGHVLPTTPAPPEAPLLRARTRRAAAPASTPAERADGRTAARPGPSNRPGLGPRSGPPAATHPWRRPLTPIGAARGQSH
ncbi:MAG TPA: ISNCY family transposase [Chloroflexota bacterium]